MILPRHESPPEHPPRPEEADINLYVRMPDWRVTRHPPGKLAQMLGLHLYSEVLLDKNARTEMNYAAIIITVVSLFELVAWGFLFNAIFNSDILRIGWGTIPAILLAFLFAFAILWFERQFLTTDESSRGKRTWIAGLIRGLFILTSAFITAQPLELLFFRIPIEKRIHEEGIREEAASKLGALLKEVEQGTKYQLRKIGRREQAYQDLQKQISGSMRQKALLQAQISSRESEQAARAREADWYRAEMESAADPEAREEARKNYLRAEARRAAAASQIPRLREEIVAVDRTIENLGDQADQTYQQVDELEDAQRQEETGREQRLRNWIDQLKASKPGETMRENWSPPQGGTAGLASGPLWSKQWIYQAPEYDFFEQIRIVLNLAEGQPPGWRNATERARRMLEADYGLASQGEGGRQRHLWAAILACHLIALFIPFLVLCIKLVLMPAALRRYYSSRHQAEAGDHDAWLALRVEAQVLQSSPTTREEIR